MSGRCIFGVSRWTSINLQKQKLLSLYIFNTLEMVLLERPRAELNLTKTVKKISYL